VKVRRTHGEESFTIAILGPGDFFGEMAVLDQRLKELNDYFAKINCEVILGNKKII
jgi:CRP-like cAMP-binding protein